MLIDFLYNNGSSSLFNPPGGDSNPNALYYEKADCALRARNFGKALVRLKPIDEATAQWTTSVMFVRGKDPERHAQSDPDQLLCRPRRRPPQHRLGGGPERPVPARLGGDEHRHEEQRPAR